jgi:hypothetical protein
MSGKRLALIRHEAGIKDAWLTRPGNATTWNVSEEWLVSQVNQVSQVSQSSSVVVEKKVEEYAP